MSVDRVALDHYRARQRLVDAAAKIARQVWGRIDPADLDGSWARMGPDLLVALMGAQQAAAGAADGYVDDVAADLGAADQAVPALNARALSGVASDGRPLASLLENSIFAVKSAIAGGATIPQAMASGYANLDMIVRTQVADAGRVADQVAITARPMLKGYRRMLVGQSCSRCVVLAGKWYRYNAGFQRHPRCDCIHVPAEDSGDTTVTNPRAYFDSLSRAEQDKAFTISGAKAIRDGADIGQVVNARRGAAGLAPAGSRLTADEIRTLRGGRDLGRLERTNVFGQDLFVTTEGTTVRGQAGRALGAREDGVRRPGTRYRSAKAPRLMPESIYEIAGDDRNEAIRLLRRNGYLTDTSAARAVRPRIPAQAVRPASVPRITPPPAPAFTAVKGRDRLAAEVARLNADPGALENLGRRITMAGWDLELGGIGTRQGFDAITQVATRAEVDAAVARGWTEVWRGTVARMGTMPAEFNEQFRTGIYQPGRGHYGNGWYFSERRQTAEVFRGKEPKTNFPAGGGPDFELSDLEGKVPPGSLLRVALSPEARVVDFDDLVKMADRWRAAQPADSPAVKVLTDPGRFAAAMGYDVIRVSGRYGDGGYYPGWHDAEDPGGAVQYVVLNRSVVMAQRAEDVP